MFTLVQLECFVAVAEELHFGAAAERLRMTQPPISRQIQQLERELDTQLFVRTSRRVALTEAGRTLLPSARKLIDLSAKAAADVRAVGEGATGTLTVGYTAVAAHSVLPKLLRAAAEELPGLQLILQESVTVDQMDELERGTVDIGLLRPMRDRPGVQSTTVLTERLVLALPRGSRLAEFTGPVFLSDLNDEALLMYSPGGARYFHDLLLSMFVASSSHPRIVQYAGQVPALLALVNAGIGVALIPESATQLAPDGVICRPVADGDRSEPYNRVHLDIAWREDSDNPLVAAVVELMQRNA
ncbi:LysR family transcriptional regulator [Pseudoclavibacter sp. RFBA6]|uniref:LysR family transcriptional regulator n=1 Tax=Pseudoclavibacter sp. RFBA6 TaxID=2080573 RepID=UPI000CE76BD4|nr:LysR family transcriptional regulator [Pseudoclavibacter sp. RFBA6]PPG40553.1 LysR family transcriptional regulator [Pseudoclavibacter sp. RFBA6]